MMIKKKNKIFKFLSKGVFKIKSEKKIIIMILTQCIYMYENM